MTRYALGAIGRMLLALASMAFLTAVGLLIVGSFLATWPILRCSPRERRVRATVQLASAGVAMLTAFADRAGADG